MDEALKPCPFCGNDGSGPIEHALHVSHTQNDWHSAYDCYSVQCDKCTVSMGYSDNEAEAIAAWNTRADAAPTPNAEVVEAVARAVAPMMEGGREFDQMPPTRLELRQWSRSGMCSTNDATQDDATELAQAAIAALDAARGKAEPVAWMYHHPGDIEHGWQRYEFRRRIQSYEGMSCIEEDAGMIETPLYTHPPAPDAARGDPVARVVEWLRKENGLCDCHAHSETECGCGAWDDWKTKPLLEIADAIERGEPFHD